MNNVFTRLAGLALLLAIGATPVRAENFPGDFLTSGSPLLDTVPPTVVCIGPLDLTMMAWGFNTLWATDLLVSASDDVTPSNQLQFGIRHAGQGTGFPLDLNTQQPFTHVIFTCDQLGSWLVELWVRDAAGNTDSCQATIIVNDQFCTCGCNGISVLACAKEPCSQTGIVGVNYHLEATHPALPPVNVFDAGDDGGCGKFINALPILADYTLTPTKNDNPMNGVSTFDLVLMSKHILGIEPLDSPYKIIAADINHSNSVSTFDIVELRKLILGIYSAFPNNTSWRFLDEEFQFANPLDPFASAPFPENFTVANVQASQFGDEFTGIKIGDLNCSAVADLAAPVEERAPVSLVLPDWSLRAGETVDVLVFAAEAAGWLGFQLALLADPDVLVIEAVLAGELPDFEAESSTSSVSGTLNVSWFTAQPYQVAPDASLFTLRLRASAPVRLRDVLTLDAIRLTPEVYTIDEQRRPLALTFAEKTTAVASAGSAMVFPVLPNPTMADAVLPVRLPAATTVRLEVLDLSGRTLFFKEIACEAGFQTLELPAAVMRQTGVYGWKLVANGQIFTGRLVRQ